ncbi:MFS transporter, MHS family, proline/betaine transporter [Burkholderia sp. YR290]|uniref:MFS transporter n=1 Tax=Paraburkholderia hospita TaxID=169430 RepID=UPI0009A72D93|nr:MFS transporter [Paraburkholderia hospita]SKC92369.1 MFS transporter, MHS family, proline/betaine transporter [Paraburkholderia hospita]SOE90749.1 MFS transporter, MHS family, proline/betaine transporter [Burkholderia sp. YR290]
MSTLALEKAGLSKTQVIAATTLGTALEFYDFTIYSFFAIQIGQLFFPSASPVNQFLLSIGVFGVGFVVRPLGGIVIGAYADRAGRKKAMVLTIMLMALSCALIASAPPYAVAGMAAPFIVLAARLIQGFAAGGEFGPGTTLLVEYASDSTRAFFASWNFAATALGLALGAAVATLINVSLPKDAVLAWGWRIPFVLGIVAAPVGMLIRRRLEETLSDASSARTHRRGALKAALTTHLKLTILGTFAELGGSVSVYITAFFLPSHAVRTLHLSSTASVASGVISSLVLFVAAPIAGKLADRFSRKRVLVISRVTLLLTVYPAFAWLSAQPSTLMLCAVSAFLALFVAGQIVPVLVMIPELFPKHVRATGIALTYVVSASFFGGFSPFVASWLVALTGNPLAPAWYVAAACAVSLVPVIWLRDRTGEALD